jgi:hypothetical protein
MSIRGHFRFAAVHVIWGRKTMGKTMKKRTSARRAATFMAVLGALVMSSGVALVATATSANATAGHDPVGICHATSSDTNPYVFITVDRDSARYKGHLMHRDHPNKQWKSDGSFELGGEHSDGDAKPDYIDGLDGNITAESCDAKGDVEVPPAVADVDFTDPTCALPDSGSIDKTGSEGVNFIVVPDKESYSIGDEVTVDASAGENTIDGDTHWTHTFVASDAPCETIVDTPTESEVVVSPPKVKHHKANVAAPTVTPTVVHAGLTSVSADDMRGEQGLALMFAGMLLMVAAGGLGLRLRGAASRI